MLARLIFAVVRFRARKGLAERAPEVSEATALAAKKAALGTGIRGETYAYWYLRRQGYIPIARNFTVPGVKGEIDIVGYDGRTLAFVEVKTRILPQTPSRADLPMAEQAVDWKKRQNLARMAKQFLRLRRLEPVSYRFDIVAIECREGTPPQIRLHKGAFAGKTQALA